MGGSVTLPRGILCTSDLWFGSCQAFLAVNSLPFLTVRCVCANSMSVKSGVCCGAGGDRVLARQGLPALFPEPCWVYLEHPVSGNWRLSKSLPAVRSCYPNLKLCSRLKVFPQVFFWQG